MKAYEGIKDGNGVNWYESDFAMKRYGKRYLSSALRTWGEERLVAMGDYASGLMDHRAQHTDRTGSPQLIRYNRYGEEMNEVWYNEGYQATVVEGYRSGVVALRYSDNVPEPVPFFYSQLLHMLMSEAETGFTCPVTLTMSVAFVLEKFGNKEQKAKYLPRLGSMNAEELMQGATFLTEIQGGSDVGATQTTAVKSSENRWLLTGEKWFASNCDADVSITLARISDAPGTKGLGLFLMPRVLKDGQKNRITIRRLKDKLGVRAVASGELELQEAEAELIGEADKGFKYMAEALNISRMCTAMGGLAISRRAYLEALIHVNQRQAFGKSLIEYPMIRKTLLDMITDIEAGWALVAQMIHKLDLCHTYQKGDEKDIILSRVYLAMAKYRLSENGVRHAKEALELFGGNGYIEDFVLPRLLRDAQVNTVWEGPSNIMGLEIIKILVKELHGDTGKQGAIFVEMESTLNGITHPSLQQLLPMVQAQLTQITKETAYLINEDESYQNAYARHYADKLIDVFTATHLLEEAQYDIEVEECSRLARIAEYYIQRAFHPDKYGIGGSLPPIGEEFASIIR